MWSLHVISDSPTLTIFWFWHFFYFEMTMSFDAFSHTLTINMKDKYLKCFWLFCSWWQHSSNLASYEQQDAHEFFISMLDMIHESERSTLQNKGWLDLCQVLYYFYYSFDFCVFYSETISGTCFTLYPLKSLASYYITAFYSRVWRLPLYCT